MGLFNWFHKKTSQKAEKIDSSTVNQAGRDQYILNNGVPFNEVNALITNMKSIIQDVVRTEIQNHDVTAQKTIQSRVLDYDDAVTAKLSSPENIPLLEKFKDPDVQRVLRTSLIQYICRGDQETKEDMVDMLIDRLNSEGKTVEQSVIDEAITVLPRLSKASVSFLALLHYRSLLIGGNSLIVIVNFSIMGRLLEPLKDLSPLDIAYLRQLSCCIDISGLSHYLTFEEILQKQYNYLFKDYGTKESLGELLNSNPIVNMQLGDSGSFIMDGMSNRLFFMCPNQKALENILQASGYADRIPAVKNFCISRNVLSVDEVRRILVSHSANWQYALEILNRDNVQKLELTPLGVYIAKKAIKKNIGLNTPELERSFNKQ